jgi:hypothetical protein
MIRFLGVTVFSGKSLAMMACRTWPQLAARRLAEFGNRTDGKLNRLADSKIYQRSQLDIG